MVVTPPTSVSASASASLSSASVARLAVRDELGDHRVVGDTDLVALGHARVDAHAVGQPQPLDAPRLRQERERVLGVEPHLHRVAL